MLVGAVLVGVNLHERAGLDVPVIKGLISNEKTYRVMPVLKYGIAGGLTAGVLISAVSYLYYPVLPAEFIAMGEKTKLNPAVRFLYGGITEEILMRFGLMTFLVWLGAKIFRGLTPFVYWFAIVISALLFALGHFPIVFQSVGNPSGILLSYIMVGNTLGGLVFGWLYWKKGLEAAMVAHIFTHVAMLLLDPLLPGS